MEYCNLAKYLLSMAIGHTLLDRKLLKKNEFLAYENIMREKYGLSRASIFRDYLVMHQEIPRNKTLFDRI